MITAYIWGAGTNAKCFAFWGWVEKDPQACCAPHIVCGRPEPRTGVPRPRYIVCHPMERQGVAPGSGGYKVVANGISYVRPVAADHAGKAAETSGAKRIMINGNGPKIAADNGPAKAKSTSDGAEKISKITN